MSSPDQIRLQRLSPQHSRFFFSHMLICRVLVHVFPQFHPISPQYVQTPPGMAYGSMRICQVPCRGNMALQTGGIQLSVSVEKISHDSVACSDTSTANKSGLYLSTNAQNRTVTLIEARMASCEKTSLSNTSEHITN